jgi:MerR HTH family regulatory protein
MLPEAATTDKAREKRRRPREKKRRKKKAKRWLTKPAKAGKHGVTTRTIDRWVELGILNPPKKVRKRCYFDEDDEPRADTVTTT